MANLGKHPANLVITHKFIRAWRIVQVISWDMEAGHGFKFGNSATAWIVCIERLDKRFARLVHDLWNGVGRPLPFACQDWANTKAAYRFLSSERVTEADILASHFRSTKAMAAHAMSTCAAPLLIVHDTTEFI